jgi:RNA polymerase sigma-70 factor (ECF subfamily)
MAETAEAPEVLLARARAGDAATLGRLLASYRNYLRLMADTQMGPALRSHVEPSDLVQEALLEAHRDFGQFNGGTEPELLAWLRRILARNLLDQARRHRAQVRDPRRAASLEALMEESGSGLVAVVAARGSSPSSYASRREQAVLLADALERLAPDYREVIVLRNLQELPFEEIAQRLGRKPGAVRMLWVRALEKLGQEMGATS